MADKQEELGIVQVLLTKAWEELQQHPIAAISSLIAIIIGLAALTKKGRTIVKRFIYWAVEKAKPSVPTQTLRVVPNTHERWWHMGKSHDKPAMQIVTSLHVTNITDKPVQIVSTIIKPTNTTGFVMVRHPKDDIYGDYPILPDSTSMAHVHFWIQPPIKRSAENFKGTVILIDQYGNKHKIKNIVFQSDPKEHGRAEEPSIPGESVYSLNDPIEREIVSILKNEVNRYKDCGRRVGGLGSVHTILEGKTYRGVPPDVRKVDSHEQQEILEDLSKVVFKSDNIQAILKIFGRSESTEEKEHYAGILLSRLAKDTEYAPIGYFIWLVLFKVGFHSRVLRVAKERLLGDSKYGFSDMLRLIDGWLRFAHSDFSDQDLDDIELFLDGVNEHTFRIKERINAIRSYRIAKGGQ